MSGSIQLWPVIRPTGQHCDVHWRAVGGQPSATETDTYWHLPIAACCLTGLRPFSDHTLTELLLL